jgi:predicted O-methyltransferase YrrM
MDARDDRRRSMDALDAYLSRYDDSHRYATARDALRHICRAAAAVEPSLIVELGSWRGASAIALAIACPAAHLLSVDGGHEVPASERAARFAEAGVAATCLSSSSGLWLAQAEPYAADVIYHDAEHGPTAAPEYLRAWQVCRQLLAVHDWERVPGGSLLDQMQPASHMIHTDARGRQTLLAWRC